MNTPSPPSSRRLSLHDQASALAIVLRQEFGTTFALFDAASGIEIRLRDSAGPFDAHVALKADDAVSLAKADAAHVALQSDGSFLVVLITLYNGRPALVAAGRLPSLTRHVADMPQEQARLQKWAQAVSDRLRQAEQLHTRHRNEPGADAQVKTAWETVLRLDHVIRRLRIHKEDERNQKRVLHAAYEMLGVETLAWVPRSPDLPVHIVGDGLLSAWDFRHLAGRIAQATEFAESGHYINNEVGGQSWAGRFPRVGNLLVLPVNDHGSQGWVFAINKRDGSKPFLLIDRGKTPHTPWAMVDEPGTRGALAPFRRGDAVLLTPFVGLLDLQVRSSGRYRELRELLVGLARSLTAAIDAKDSYTFGHSERVARIAVELGRELGLQGEELSDIFLAGLLHDIGKIGIRDAVLGKPAPLTPEEFEHVKQHTLIGYSILENLKPIQHLLPGIRNHHERFDGDGYPDRLAGDQIPLLARIIAVADSYDAMTTDRPYRAAIPLEKVHEMLQAGAGSQWDRRVVDAFAACREQIHGIRHRGVGDSLRFALDGALRTVDSLRSTAPIPMAP